MVALLRPTSESESTTLDRATAYEALALRPTADGNLVEIAYWCHVEIARTSDLPDKQRRTRLAALNDARAVLAAPDGTVTAPARPPEVRVPRPRAPFWTMAISHAIAVAVPAVAVLLLRRESVSDETTLAIGAGAVILGLLLARAFWIRIPPVLPPVRLTDEQACGQLRLTAAAPPPLRLLSHQYLRRRAILARDYDAVRALDAAAGLLRDVPPAVAPSLTPVPSAIEEVTLAPEQVDTAEPDITPAASEPEQPAAAEAHAPAAAAALIAASAPEDDYATAAATDEPQAAPTEAAVRQTVAEDSGLPGIAVASGVAATRAAGAGPAGAALLILRGGARVSEVALENGRVYTIGSVRSADIKLADHDAADQAPVAAEHARLTVRRGRVLFHHVGEQFESKVNGIPTEWAVIEPGDEIAIGDYVLRCEAGAA